MAVYAIVSSKLRDRTLWVLSVAALLGAILPSLGMVLHSTAAGFVAIEICSAQGNRFILVAAEDSGHKSPAPYEQTSAPHCPLCILPGSIDIPPPVTGNSIAVVTGALSPLVVGSAEQIPLQPRSTTQSRAPPIIA